MSQSNVLPTPTAYGRQTPSLIMAWPDGTPTPAADPAVLAELQRKGYTLRDVDGFRCLIVPVAQLVTVMEVG